MANTQFSSWGELRGLQTMQSSFSQRYDRQIPTGHPTCDAIPIDTCKCAQNTFPEGAQARTALDYSEQLLALQKYYTFLDSDPIIIKFLDEEPALYLLLGEAVEPLRSAFGKRCILQARVVSSDEDSLLKVAVQLPASFGDPESALRSFDQDWWLNNCHRSGAGLVFDYEIQNAV